MRGGKVGGRELARGGERVGGGERVKGRENGERVGG